MVGANPKFQTSDRLGQVILPCATPHGSAQAAPHYRAPTRLSRIALLAALVPLSLALVQCGKAPNAEMLAANSQDSAASFENRFPATPFNDRFTGANENFVPWQSSDALRKRTAQAQGAPYRVASLTPTLPLQLPPIREHQTTLVSLKSSAFPSLGNNPRTDEPFLNVSKGDRRGHRGLGG